MNRLEKYDKAAKLALDDLTKELGASLSKMHIFELKLKTIDRTTTRGQWKEISRWLRVSRNHVEQRIDRKAMNQYLVDMITYGTAVIRLV